MQRAGYAIAAAITARWPDAPSTDIHVLCGPGNNGGDGYVAARQLAARGVAVRIAALADPKSDAAKAARHSHWAGIVEALGPGTEPAPLLIDSQPAPASLDASN
jgi:NAD(P)H-hydrate repair Nnr-like enzyme with NAD(P)H-hydrate epimerase domain